MRDFFEIDNHFEIETRFKIENHCEMENRFTIEKHFVIEDDFEIENNFKEFLKESFKLNLHRRMNFLIKEFFDGRHIRGFTFFLALENAKPAKAQECIILLHCHHTTRLCDSFQSC